MRDVTDPVADRRRFDADRECVLPDLEQPPRFGTDLAHREGESAVGDCTVEGRAYVDRHEIAFGDDVEPGIPWTTTSFREMQIAPGNGHTAPG